MMQKYPGQPAGLYLKPVLLLVLLSALMACDVNPEPSLPTLTGPDVERIYDASLISQGQLLYVRHCADCHGPAAEGDVHWRKPDAEGFYPPPPLDGSGHAWHHSGPTLHEMIKKGSPVDEQGRPRGKMPAWRQTINDQEIEALIAWFQSLWPDPVYAIWYEREQRVRGIK